MKHLYNYQYDFIKAKLYKVDLNDLNWNNLKPHKTLKNHFKIDSKGLLYDDNFDLYIDKGGNITIATSFPYLVHGHNHTNFDSELFSQTIKTLSKIIGVDVSTATILEMEFAGFEHLDISCKHYINSVVGLQQFQLEKATSNFKMYGNHKDEHFKIYNAVENAKRKKTFSASKFKSEDIVKYEIKLTKTKKTVVRNLYDLCKPITFNLFKTQLNNKVENLIIKQNSVFTPLQTSLNHVLFTTLKNLEQQSGIAILPSGIDTINQMDISSSQKSKRKKALLELESTYNAQNIKR